MTQLAVWYVFVGVLWDKEKPTANQVQRCAQAQFVLSRNVWRVDFV